MRYTALVLVLIIFISGCTQVSLTPEKLMEEKDNLLNNEITIEGTADINKLICTSLQCPEDAPCCNTCEGTLILKGEKEKIIVKGKYNEVEIRCRGNDCTMICYPLEKNKKYQVTGIWKKINNEYYLELNDFRLVE